MTWEGLVDEMQRFAERAVSYLGSAARTRDHNRREQYLELAACCLEAAARRAHALVGNAVADAEPLVRNGTPHLVGEEARTEMG